jgi:tetratricopeptide (TPR) repeat protein
MMRSLKLGRLWMQTTNEFAGLYLQAEIYDAKGDHDQANKVRDNAAATIQKKAASDPAWRKSKPDIDPRVLFLNDPIWKARSGYPAFPSEIVLMVEPRTAFLPGFERFELATAYFRLGRIANGKEQWEKAMVSDSVIDNAVGHANLGEELFKAGAFDDALPHFRRAYALDPHNTTFLMDYDAVRQRLGK